MPFKNRSLRELIPLTPYMAVALIVFIAALSGLVSLADEVVEGEALAVDVRLLELINQISTPWLDDLFIWITWLGDIIFVAAATTVACAILAKRSRQRAAVFIASSVIGSVIISNSLKLLFARARPDLWQSLVAESTFSFPSGHAIASSTLALSVSIILWRTKWRWSAVTVGVLYVVLVGFSRLYLGAHYPSDVLAGWLVSTCWVLMVGGIMPVLGNTSKQ